jgi:hypothetical protein
MKEAQKKVFITVIKLINMLTVNALQKSNVLLAFTMKTTQCKQTEIKN